MEYEQKNRKEVSESRVTLPDGRNVLIKVAIQGEDDIIVSSQILDDNLQDISSGVTYCGYCNGELIGCVTCVAAEFDLDCVRKEVACPFG